MRIAVLGDFKHDTLRNTQIITRKLCKGLTRIGHDVIPFSYRNVMLQLSPFPSKTIAKKMAKRRTDLFCCELIRNYRPDLVIVTTFRNLDRDTIALIRTAVPHATYLGWYEDTLDALNSSTADICKLLDWFIATGGGEYLANFVNECGVRGAFMPNPCDPDIEKHYNVPDPYKCNVLFTGKLTHKSCNTDDTRAELIKQLIKKHDMIVCGPTGQKKVLGMEYFRRISGAKIAVSINSANNIRMYHSDRLINYSACGTFVLAKYVPDSEMLFQDKQHLRYFDTVQQCLELVDYYLDNANEKERKEIARRGMQHAHKVFNCQSIAQDIIDLVTTGRYERPWTEII